MESAWVAQVCALHEVPFLAVRVISNSDAARSLAGAEVAEAIAGAGRRAASVLAAVAREWGQA
jgi:nucleoside phosphorylase